VGTVRIGPSQLQQVVLNVLLNAREAVSAGGSIRVHTAQRTVQPREARLPERVGRWVVLSVADTGVGMDPATQARVFEPFFSTKRSGHGAGLGLSTAYGLVKQAGGWIDVQSQQGKGTTVEIHLPLHADVPIGEPKGSAPSQSPSAETVLVCDDETRLATLTAGLLDQYGYGAVTVTNCEQAIAALGAAEPACHLVLLDVSLPDGSASKVLEQMRAHGYAQPVILTSGYAEEDVPQELMSDAQVVGYLAKPYSVDRLVEAIRRVLDERGSRP
jgi:two-component system cell cycle sensor histidine kinase/response regulator CckA